MTMTALPRIQTATATVTSVAIQWCRGFDFVHLSCGHSFFLETDESNASLVGAETQCEGCR